MIESTGLQKIDSMLLSEYILQRGGAMSHLKLQKLLYYIEAFHLAYFDESIIDDNFEAWMHGPVSRKVYDTVKGYSILYREVKYIKDSEKTPEDILPYILTNDQIEIVNDIIDEYGKLTALQLENLTHSESPWIEARIGYSAEDRCTKIISKDSMRRFYKALLYEQDKT